MNNLAQSAHNYFSDHYRHVIICATNTLDDPSPENFHQLRISLKRIRFIGNFLKTYGKSKSQRSFKPYTKLFRYAGRIRENHILVYLLRKYADEYTDKAIFKSLRTKEGRLIKKWPQAAILYLPEIVHSYLKITKELSKCTVSSAQYLYDLEQHLERWFSTKLVDYNLHKSRKTLKGILYSAEFSPEFKRSINHFCNLKVPSTLEDAIGDWHDLEVVMLQHNRIHQKPAGKNLIKQKHRERLKINGLRSHLIRTTKSSSIQ